MTGSQQSSLEGIAIVGMAGRFPGAQNVEDLWRNLCAGAESIRHFTDEELLEAGIDPAHLQMPNYVKARGALGDAEYFDAAFFGHSPRVAELMDPQHRLFLECAWSALESAGYDPERYAGRVGVYAGESMNTYVLNNLYTHLTMVASVDSLQAAIGNDKDSLTTEVAYKLNLRGPCVTIQTASSTSLVAVHVACQSLLSYECDMALAGGISIHFPEMAGYLYQEGGATSPDGRCRAFDAQAQGFVNGHGAGIVVLKRLEDALAERDMIYAVIKGSAVNNDGSLKVSYMAPSIEGQAEVIRMAQALAGVDADSIGYIEAHGTGTALGDPIELAALTQAFRASTSRQQFCAIGSIKPNIGHLDTAAGIAGLIKAALAIKHNRIPASINYSAPNPRIDFASSPFYVNTELSSWPLDDGPRRAGVSSFGMGGTNAHVVLEQPPDQEETGPSRPWQLLLLSARSAAALEQATANLAQHLREHGTQAHSLADMAYTLQLGRRAFAHRRALVCRSHEEALALLESARQQPLPSNLHEGADQQVVFLFSGQGAQYVQMARGLYEQEAVFRAELDRCCELLRPHLRLDLRDLLYPEEAASAAAAQQLQQTALAQPALFALEYALAQQWMAWGIKPQALIGHSLGEYVAACLAGVFTLPDALALIAARGRLMQAMPPGAMLAIPLAEAELLPLLGGQLALAANNAPGMCVVSGQMEEIAALRDRLQALGIQSRPLHTSHAFHSSMMDPILEPFERLVAQVPLSPPQIPFVSNLTGRWISAAEACDPAYWARHLRQPVRFAEGLGSILEHHDGILLEVGPGQSLSTFARQHPARNPQQLVLGSLRHPQEQQHDLSVLLSTLGKLWMAGAPVDWQRFYADERRGRLPLPTYPFERQRFWVEPLRAAPALVEEQPLRRPEGQWLYQPGWMLRPLVPGVDPAQRQRRWLLLLDQCGVGSQLAGELVRAGQQVVDVRAGAAFEQLDGQTYQMQPGSQEHYVRLLAQLRERDQLPDIIVHLWSLSAAAPVYPDPERLRLAQEQGFYSLLFLAQALQHEAPAHSLRIMAISNHTQQISAEEPLCPEKSTLLGPCRVIPQEYAGIDCRSVDIALPRGGWQAARLMRQLIGESLAATQDRLVAYRQEQRWVQRFEALPADAHGPSRLRPQGVYMITGGLGSVGFELARLLSRSVQARLVLVSRSGLAGGGDTAQAALRAARVAELETLGAQVHVVVADVADMVAMEAAVAETYQRFGALHGVIHAAGLVGRAHFQAIQQLSAPACEEQFRAKLLGTLALERVLASRELDFCVLVSSLASVLGGLGLAAYTAANCFLDSMARLQQRGPAPWISVSWDAWQSEEVGHEAPGTLTELALTPEEGARTFERILRADAPAHLVVSTGDLPSRIARWSSPLAAPAATTAERTPAQTLYPRPHLQTAYVPPRSDVERSLVEIWQETLLIDQVGIDDNFFELGGNSLTGLQVIATIKARFGVQVPTVSLYEGPSISRLAPLLVGEEQMAPAFEQGLNRGERRRARLQRRRQAPDDQLEDAHEI